MWTPHYCGQFALTLGQESPYIFFKFNPLVINTDTFYGPLSQYVRESKTVLDSGFHATDSGFQVLDSSLCEWNLDSGLPSLMGFWIL